MSGQVLNCGYVPLVDSAPLIIAKELGFARQQGITLNLLRQPSWAALRDLLALGHLDAAQMLAPMPAAMSLGLSGPRVETVAPMVLSINGTVLGLSSSLADEMRRDGWSRSHSSPKSFRTSLVKLDRPLRVGVPFPYSMHRLLFEYLIADAPPEFSKQISIITTPPPQMAQAVAQDEIDIFAVGEPWGTVSVSSGAAEIALVGADIWAHAPEKVLGMREAWVSENIQLASALTRAVYRACCWLGQRSNHALAREILARSEHLDLPDHAIDPSFSGLLLPGNGDAPMEIKNFLKFGDSTACFPWRSFGAWIGSQISQFEGLRPESTIQSARRSFRPDLYRQFLGGTEADMPGASEKVEGSLAHATAVASTKGQMILEKDAFFDGKTFDFSVSR